MSKDNNNGDKEKFASRLGFILVSAGCAIGLGNVEIPAYMWAERRRDIYRDIYTVSTALGISDIDM